MAIESKNLLVWVKAMSRGQALPLDASEVYGSYAEAETYAGSATAYAGQTIKALMEDGKYHSYTLQPSEAGYVLEEVGAIKASDLKQYVISNGSPLFSGGTTSGESQIRRYMLEADLVEAIIALPTQLFYNTDIGIYIFILSKHKRPDRKGKVQLINAVDFWKPLRKSLGKKRREIDRDSMKKITELYANFEENEYCKIFSNEEFMYKEPHNSPL